MFMELKIVRKTGNGPTARISPLPILPIVDRNVPRFVSPNIEKHREKLRDSSARLKTADKAELEGILPAVFWALDNETDAISAKYLLDIVEVAASKGCTLAAGFPTLEKYLDAKQPPGPLKFAALSVLPHIVHELGPLLPSAVNLLDDPSPIKEAATNVLKEFASRDIVSAVHVKTLVGSRKGPQARDLRKTCDEVIRIESKQNVTGKYSVADQIVPDIVSPSSRPPSNERLRSLVSSLSSSFPGIRQRAAQSLKDYAHDAETAREVNSLLPPGNSIPVADVRRHCLGKIRANVAV